MRDKTALPPISHLLHPQPQTIKSVLVDKKPTPRIVPPSGSPAPPQSTNLILPLPFSMSASYRYLRPRRVACRAYTGYHTPPSPLSPNTRPSEVSKSSLFSLPPLQGNDPPRPLRTYSTYQEPRFSPWAHSSTAIHGLPSPCLHRDPPFPTPPALPAPNPEPTPTLSHSRTCSNSSNSSSTSGSSRHRTPLPSATILFTATGEPILKRRRGRPPNIREPSWKGGWLFLAPTVWNVNSSSTTTAGNPPAAEEPNSMDSSMTAFTSLNLDTVLPMPRRKRGRKPKTHIAGNSCFVWKDIPATRSSSRRK